MVMCRETCVYSAKVRDVLTLWHPVEFKGMFTRIKNNPKYNIYEIKKVFLCRLNLVN